MLGVESQAFALSASERRGMNTMQSVGGFDGAADAAWGPGVRESKANRAYLALKRAIVAGDLAPLIGD